jgi:hypothetical protein
MTVLSPNSECLVLSLGQWDQDAPNAYIEDAIAKFFDWLARSIDEGRMKMGCLLGTEGAVVFRPGIVTDGLFGEAKEVIGGYWFIVARNLREAAELAVQTPCARYGLSFKIRPLESARASDYSVTNEAPTV